MGSVSSRFSRQIGKRTSPACKGNLKRFANDHIRSKEKVKEKHIIGESGGKNLRCVDGYLRRYPGNKECSREDGKNAKFHCESDQTHEGRMN